MKNPRLLQIDRVFHCPSSVPPRFLRGKHQLARIDNTWEKKKSSNFCGIKDEDHAREDLTGAYSRR
jgi:hypothetical protein